MGTDTTHEQFGSYDFGLTPEEELRAAKLHTESIITDMLYWGPCSYRHFTLEMEKELCTFWSTYHDPVKTNQLAMFYPSRLAVRHEFPVFKESWDASGITAGNRMVGFATYEEFAHTFGYDIALFDNLPWLIKALRAEDIRRAKVEGKHAAWINTQLGHGISTNFLELIEPAYNLGLRMIQLTYNSMNLIGAGCTERTDAGVSNYGAKVIALMNKLGIIIDVSHCGRQTTLDACSISKTPVVVSHATAEEVYKHARGKNDEELHAVAETGGVIGVVTVPFFLAPDEVVGIEAMLDHIDYITNLVGWQHVGIGTDWPMPMPKSILKDSFSQFTFEAGFRVEDKIDPCINLVGFDDYRDFPNITRGLVKRGYKDEQIRGLLGENFLRVFKEVCG